MVTMLVNLAEGCDAIPQSILELVRQACADLSTVEALPLIEALIQRIQRRPAQQIGSAVSELRDIISAFFHKASSVKGNGSCHSHRHSVDELYLRLLSTVQPSCMNRNILQEDLDLWSDILTAPFSEPPTPLCALAFTECWKETFAHAQDLALSDQLRAVLHILSLALPPQYHDDSLQKAVSRPI